MAESATEGLRGERFVGRATELAALRAQLAEAEAGRARKWRPVAQVEFLDDRVERLRYEKFEWAVKIICRRLGVPVVKPDDRVNFYGKYDWRTLMDQRGLEIINDRFRGDFDELGYEMLTWNQLNA